MTETSQARQALAGLRPKAAAPTPKLLPARARAGASGWLWRQAERLDAIRTARAAQAASWMADVELEDPVAEPASLAAEREESRTGLQIMHAGFQVGRHVRYILGRPVQVSLVQTVGVCAH
jgi:hypothetical protein